MKSSDPATEVIMDKLQLIIKGKISENKCMVVVVGERTPLWAVLAVIIVLILVVVAVLMFIVTGGRGTLLVVAIPGFPVESIILGLALGVLLVTLKRRPVKKSVSNG